MDAQARINHGVRCRAHAAGPDGMQLDTPRCRKSSIKASSLVTSEPGELDWLTADLPALVRAPRRSRRRGPTVTAVVICALLVALLVIVPPEVWLGLFALAMMAGLIGFVMFAPIAIPILVIATIVHLVARATRPHPRPPVGWR